MRPTMVLLGLGLWFLWVLGLEWDITPWLVWVTYSAGTISIALAILPLPDVLRRAPFAFAFALTILFIAGRVTDAPAWFPWWVFVYALGYLYLAVAMNAPRTPFVRPDERTS